MKFKIVEVFIGCSENDIESVGEVSGSGIEEVGYAQLNHSKDRVVQAGLSDEQYFESFYNWCVIHTDSVAWMNVLNDRVVYVLGEKTKWFGLVDNYDSWSVNTLSDWHDFVNSGDPSTHDASPKSICLDIK